MKIIRVLYAALFGAALGGMLLAAVFTGIGYLIFILIVEPSKVTPKALIVIKYGGKTTCISSPCPNRRLAR